MNLYMRYNRVAKFMVKIWWVKGVIWFVMKYFFARTYFRAGVSDFGRNTVAAFGQFQVYGNLKKINEALVIFDKFPHSGESQS